MKQYIYRDHYPLKQYSTQPHIYIINKRTNLATRQLNAFITHKCLVALFKCGNKLMGIGLLSSMLNISLFLQKLA